MKWVTREHPKTDRIACPWLIRKFIDPDAEILYVPDTEVLSTAEREGAISFDAPGARYTHRDGLCSFEVLIADYQLTDPPWKSWLPSFTAPISTRASIPPASRPA